MRKTSNIELSLYDPTDTFDITGSSNSLNHNMEIIDQKFSDTPTSSDIEKASKDIASLKTETNSLKGDLSALQNGGYVADQQQIGQKVSDWLDEHPEATTTVQNGVITESKIHHDFLPYIKNNYVTPKMFGAKGDGITDDTKAINSCLKYCEENGLDCFFDRAIYKISHTGGTGGEAYSIELQPHVSIDFNNSTVISNTYDIFFRSKALNILAKAKIVNDTHEGDNKITVDEGSKFKIGDYVFIRYGENSTDTPEPEDVLYAHIVEINGNEITIDKVLPFDVSVDSITREHNNIVILISYDEVCRNITYKNLYAIGNEQTESIFYLLNCSGIRFENIHGKQTGAGLIAGQYCSNVFVNDLYITRSYGYTQISKGRGFGFSSSHNIVVDKAYIESCQRAYVIAESNTQIRFNELHIRRNGISRDLTQNYFGIFYKSSIHVKNLYIDDDCKDTNFDNYYKLTCENLFTYDKKPIKCFASPNLYLMYNDLNFNDVYTHLEVVEITEQNNTIYLPKGKIKDFTLRLNSDDTPTWLSFGRFKDDGSLNGDNLKEYFVNNGNIHPFTSRHPIFIDIYSSYLLNYTDLYPIVLVSFGKIPTNAKLSIYVRYFNN